MEIERWPGGLDTALSELAARAREVAGELGSASAAVGACGGLTWRGGAARWFEDEVAERASALVALERDVLELARTLEVLGRLAAHRLEVVMAHEHVVGMLP